MALMVLRTCQQVEGGLPHNVTAKMYFNIILDFGIGLVPFIGDLADAAFRANTRNAVELEKYLRQKGAAAIKAQGRSVPEIDPSDPDEFDRHMREEYGPPPQYNNSPANCSAAQQGESTYPAPARTPENRGGRGWFGFGSKTKQPDLESDRRHDGPFPLLPQKPAR
jgi:Domain of unknown function (DUF4112)